MDLRELVEEVARRAAWPKWRLENTKTAARLLARGLGKADPTECLPVDYLKPVDELIRALDKAQANSSPHRVRQNRNYIRHLFKTATALEIIKPLAPAKPLMSRREARRGAYGTFGRPQFRKYALDFQDWPSEIQDWWTAYEKEAGLRIRPITLGVRKERLSRYLGFLNGRARTPSDLFDPENVKAYASWLAERLSTDGIPTQAENLLGVLITLARQTEYKAAAEPLSELSKALRKAPPLHDKERELDGLSLRDLEMVGLGLLEEARRPVSDWGRERPGLYRSTAFQMGLILRLLVRIPFRQRQIREMKLGGNLFKNSDGIWMIQFRGPELKIAERNGRPNTFTVRFPADLVPLLEEYLAVHRPRLLGNKESDLVFVTSQGNPWTIQTLSGTLSTVVYQHTGKRFYPHLVRSMWATEMARNDADIRMVAYMMNDKIETVYKEYYAHSGRGLQEKAEAILATLLKEPKAGEIDPDQAFAEYNSPEATVARLPQST